jgi:hypothetical protein
MQYERLYTSVTAENERLRAENGELLRGLNSHSEALRAENSRLQARLDRTQQEFERVRKMHDATQAPAGSTSVTALHGAAGVAELDGVAEDQNLFELRIDKGDLDVSSNVASFITVDFYDHPTQVYSNRPSMLHLTPSCCVLLACTHNAAKPGSIDHVQQQDSRPDQCPIKIFLRKTHMLSLA